MFATFPLLAQMQICPDPDVCPEIFGGIDKYLAKNFKYPYKALKEAGRKPWIFIECTITSDGQVIDLKTPDSTHPALKKELERVLGESKWLPAIKGSEPVNVRYKTSLMLTESWGGLPYGIRSYLKDADKSISTIKWTLPSSDDDLEKFENTLEEASEVSYSTRPRYPIAYATLETAIGGKDKAIAAIDSCWSYYHFIPMKPLDGPWGLKLPRDKRAGHNNRTEIWLAMMRSMIHQYNSSEMADSAYVDALTLINSKIIDGDMSEPLSENEKAEIERNIRRMKKDMVNDFVRSDMVKTNTTGDEYIGRDLNFNLNEAVGTLTAFDKLGLSIGNASVPQLSKMINDEYSALNSSKKATSKEKLNLFGAKALAIWMQSGDEGLNQYFAMIRRGEPSKQLLKYLDKLEKNKAKNAALLSDRQAVLESLVCLAPTADTPEAEVKAFHARRKAVADVFPLRWLAK